DGSTEQVCSFFFFFSKNDKQLLFFFFLKNICPKKKKKITFDMKERRKGDIVQFRLRCIKNKWKPTNITLKQPASIKKIKDIPINDSVRESVENFFTMKEWLQNPVKHFGLFFFKKKKIYHDKEKHWSDEELYKMVKELKSSKGNNENIEVYKRKIEFQILKLIILQCMPCKYGVPKEIVKELEKTNSEECKEAPSSEMKALHDIVTRYHEQTEEDDVSKLFKECEQLCITQTCKISSQEDAHVSLVEPDDQSPTKQFRVYFFNPDIVKLESTMAIVICFGTCKGYFF
ncbi:hypothetical protein RFI_27598, partial [Reticulomyxa filosa]